MAEKLFFLKTAVFDTPRKGLLGYYSQYVGAL
jgi:hypothetical protein